MKYNLRMLGLALCKLPMYLHAGTGEDLKQDDQTSQKQNTRSAESIPAGTVNSGQLEFHLALGQEWKRRRDHGDGHAGRAVERGENPACRLQGDRACRRSHYPWKGI
ncbi:MAG: hypothetical protein ABSD75_10355 [Terriglobales bacterium]